MSTSALGLHDIPKGTGAVFYPEAVEEFLREEPLSSMRAEAFHHAVGQPGAKLGSRLSVVQGPPGTEKPICPASS